MRNARQWLTWKRADLFRAGRIVAGLLVTASVAACVTSPQDPSTTTVAAALTAPTCVTFQRGRLGSAADAFIKPNALRKNFGTQPVLRVSAKDEALLEFDVSSIPPHAAITSATLKLYVNGANGDGTIRVHRALVPWSETAVTYASFGQKFESKPAAQFRVESKTALKNVDLTDLVGSWAAGHPNYGLLLDEGPDHHPACARDEDDDQDPTLFVSSDGPTISKRPALEVCYTVAVDHCATNPCQNGGTCTNRSDGYSCQCPPAFAGSNCETNVDDCTSKPCKNGGTCADGVGTYACTCAPGYSGTNCQTDIDDCAPSPCKNGGVCTDGVATFSCACAPGYDGALCDHLIDSCASAPCHNGGTCVNGIGTYACTCVTGFSGPKCDTNIDDCVDNACVNGTCVDGIASHSCSCVPDWGGARCEINLNSCAQAPCLNGATCTNGFGNYACTCAPGYAGANCEIDVNNCVPNPCLNGGTCVDGVNSHTCQCAAFYSGPDCQTLTYSTPWGACPSESMTCGNPDVGVIGLCSAGVCVPDPPTLSVRGVASATVTLSWTAVDGGNPTSYTVSRGTSSGSYDLSLFVSGGVTTVVDDTVVSGTQYFYVVSAKKNGVSTTASNEVTVTPPPSAPPSLCAASIQPADYFDAVMQGCPAAQPFARRALQCGPGTHVCTAEEWVAHANGLTPTHNYWTDDALTFSSAGSSSCGAAGCRTHDCFASRGMQPFANVTICPPSQQMLVCNGDSQPDHEGNFCNWTRCGFNSAGPSASFGGCAASAGSLCCSNTLRHWYVSHPDGNDAGSGTAIAPFRTITRALASASSGDTVFVSPGTYSSEGGEIFPLVLPMGVVLLGNEAAQGRGASPTAIVGCSGSAPIAVSVGAGGTVAGFTVTCSSGTGISASASAIVRNNTLIDNFRGIDVSNSNALVLLDNVSNNFTGLSIEGASSSVKVENCQLTGNQFGVVTESSLADLGGGATQSGGNNIMSCNSSVDLYAPAMSLFAEGDLWDHVPPTLSTTSSSGGVDIYPGTGSVAVTNSGLTLSPCP